MEVTLEQFENTNLRHSTFEVEGYAGNDSYRALHTIFYHIGWYVVEGSNMAHKTDNPIYTGVDVEMIDDYDVATNTVSFESLEQFRDYVDEYCD